MHAQALQFARPDWGVAFDHDGQAAAASRRRILDRAAADRLLIAGMHLDFPGVGHVQRGNGAAYRFLPLAGQAASGAPAP